MSHVKILLLFSIVWMFQFSELVFAQRKKEITSQKKTIPKILLKTEIVIPKSFELTQQGDTINVVDQKSQRQGKWLISREARYGEVGFMEYGNYFNNMKVGEWKTYHLNGELVCEEFFKSGNKDGEARYFENGKLYCIGHYLALKSKQLYDTILVEDPMTSIEKPVVIKTEVGSVKHGSWEYFNPNNLKLLRKIEYQADEIVFENEMNTQADSSFNAIRKKVLPHITNKPPMNSWIINKNKKTSLYTDYSEHPYKGNPKPMRQRK
jgi:hypothetical protein